MQTRAHTNFSLSSALILSIAAHGILWLSTQTKIINILKCAQFVYCVLCLFVLFFPRFACIANGMFYIHVCLFVLYINALGRKYWGLTRHMHISVVCLQQIFHWNWKTWAHTTFGAFSMFDLTDGGAQIRNSEVLQTFCWLPILWINDCQARIWIILSHFAASHKLNIER